MQSKPFSKKLKIIFTSSIGLTTVGIGAITPSILTSNSISIKSVNTKTNSNSLIINSDLSDKFDLSDKNKMMQYAVKSNYSKVQELLNQSLLKMDTNFSFQTSNNSTIASEQISLASINSTNENNNIINGVNKPAIKENATGEQIKDYITKKSNEYLLQIANGTFDITTLSKMANNNGYSYQEQQKDISEFQKDAKSESNNNKSKILETYQSRSNSENKVAKPVFLGYNIADPNEEIYSAAKLNDWFVKNFDPKKLLGYDSSKIDAVYQYNSANHKNKYFRVILTPKNGYTWEDGTTSQYIQYGTVFFDNSKNNIINTPENIYYVVSDPQKLITNSIYLNSWFNNNFDIYKAYGLDPTKTNAYYEFDSANYNEKYFRIRIYPKTGYTWSDGSTKAKIFTCHVVFDYSKLNYNPNLDLSGITNASDDYVFNNSYSTEAYYDDINTARDILENIRNNGVQSGIFAGFAAAIAAGYWAASWFFGITISSAIAATTQAIVLGVEGAIYGGFYEVQSKNPEYLKIADADLLSDLNITSWYLGAGASALNIMEWMSSIKSAMIAIRSVSYTIRSGILSTVWAAPSGIGFLALAELAVGIADLVVNGPWSDY